MDPWGEDRRAISDGCGVASLQLIPSHSCVACADIAERQPPCSSTIGMRSPDPEPSMHHASRGNGLTMTRSMCRYAYSQDQSCRRRCVGSLILQTAHCSGVGTIATVHRIRAEVRRKTSNRTRTVAQRVASRLERQAGRAVYPAGASKSSRAVFAQPSTFSGVDEYNCSLARSSGLLCGR